MMYCLTASLQVATVPTVYGIETFKHALELKSTYLTLQQYLPFTVLKHWRCKITAVFGWVVATVPTVYGIETKTVEEIFAALREPLQQYLPFTVLKLYQIR